MKSPAELYVLAGLFYVPRNATEEMRSIFEVLIRALLPGFCRGVFFYSRRKAQIFLRVLKKTPGKTWGAKIVRMWLAKRIPGWV